MFWPIFSYFLKRKRKLFLLFFACVLSLHFSLSYAKDSIIMSDGISPFFESWKEIKHYSNIPFYQIDTDTWAGVDEVQLADSKYRFTAYVDTISKAGYNAISIDDVNHVLNMKKIFNSDSFLSKRNALYIAYYKDLIAIAREKHIGVYLISDMQFYNDEVEKNIWSLSSQNPKLIDFNTLAFTTLFTDFPDISGIILRIWEGWGVYNNDDYKSKIIYTSPKEVNTFLKYLLPIFEKYQKKLIFRTWSIGLWEIGNINNNTQTYDKTFDGISSKNLIVSIKYTPGDFFWFDTMNPTIWHWNLSQIVEAQIRREYEWWGDFVNYFTLDYQKIYKKIMSYPNVVWVWNWNQTWGWWWGQNILFNFWFNFWKEVNFYSVWELLQWKDDLKAITSDVLHRYNFTFEQEQVLQGILFSSREIIQKWYYIDDFRKKELKLWNIILPPLLRIWWGKTTSSPIVLSIIFNNLDNPQKTIDESAYLLWVQRNQVKAWSDVMSNTALDQHIYESLLDRYYIFEINHLFKESFIDYFQTWEKTHKTEILKKISSYNDFIKDKPYFHYDFSEVQAFYGDSILPFYSSFLFYLHILSFIAFCFVVFNYTSIRLYYWLNHKKVLGVLFLIVFTLVVTPFFFLCKENIYWLFVQVNYFLMWVIFLFFDITVSIIRKFFKINVQFKSNFWKIITFFTPIIFVLEAIIIVSHFYGEMFLWRALWFFLLTHNFFIVVFCIGMIYIFIFFVFGFYFSNIHKFLKKEKTAFIFLFIIFLFYVVLLYNLDYHNYFIMNLVKNYVPHYIEAGSVKEYF